MPAEAQQRHFKAGFLQERLKEGQWRSETRLQTLVPANSPFTKSKLHFYSCLSGADWQVRECFCIF